ncbi:hypothetical protein [Carnobacterium funditum]|uniref:hypothetical protein n=1 Tax=Carnobacterium funditum TaxID=2752 RepID=UPI000557B26C|nr:hypothetical protein [Carnobacterium funditum]
MTEAKKYYSVRIELSNGNKILKTDIRAFTADDAWERYYDPETIETLSVIDDKDIYRLLTKSHIVQVVVKETESPDLRKEVKSKNVAALSKLI